MHRIRGWAISDFKRDRWNPNKILVDMHAATMQVARGKIYVRNHFDDA
jgi:hypothetical protein